MSEPRSRTLASLAASNADGALHPESLTTQDAGGRGRTLDDAAEQTATVLDSRTAAGAGALRHNLV